MRSPSASLAALVAATLSAAPAFAAGPAQALRFAVEPSPVVLGRDAEALLRIEAPADATGLDLQVSVGAVEQIRRVGEGRWEARYLPPKQRFPQLAVLAAVAATPRGAQHGWTALPLHGQGAAEVKTRPGTKVTLRIGEREFGPVVADERGRARVNVVAPPGVREAWFGKEPHDLGVPEVPRIQVIVERRAVEGDRAQALQVRVYEVDFDGKPVGKPDVKLSATRGTVSAPRVVEPGVLAAVWKLPAGPLGDAELTGTGKSGSAVLHARVHVEAGPASSYEVAGLPPRLRAGETAGVEVRAKDSVGNPAKARLRVEHEGGATPLAEAAPGTYRGTVAVPEALAGRESLALEVVAEGSAQPVARSVVELAPAEAATLSVEPQDASPVGDGKTEVALTVRVADRFGNPVTTQAPQASADEGTLGPATQTGPGAWELKLVPPRRSEDAPLTLTVRAGELSATYVQPLQAQRSSVTLAPRVGVLTNFRDVVGLDAGAQGEVWPGLLLRDLGWRLEVGLLHHAFSAGADTPGFAGSSQAYAAVAGPALRFYPAALWRVWAWAGAGAALVQARTSVGTGPQVVDQGAVLVVQAAIGVARQLGPGMPFLEVRGAYYDRARLVNLTGELWGAGVDVGYRFEL